MRNLLIKLGPLIRQYFIASNRTCGYEHPSQMKMVDVDVSCGDNNKVIILEAAYGYEKPEIPFSSMQELLECKYLSGLGKEKNRLIKKH
ncbi:MAG: hypothetical protein FJZ80_04710 [Bacteroidetes bacterium]|nr:hypothetical protein [Bacteroidota bacterium]